MQSPAAGYRGSHSAAGWGGGGGGGRAPRVWGWGEGRGVVRHKPKNKHRERLEHRGPEHPPLASSPRATCPRIVIRDYVQCLPRSKNPSLGPHSRGATVQPRSREPRRENIITNHGCTLHTYPPSAWQRSARSRDIHLSYCTQKIGFLDQVLYRQYLSFRN